MMARVLLLVTAVVVMSMTMVNGGAGADGGVYSCAVDGDDGGDDDHD